MTKRILGSASPLLNDTSVSALAKAYLEQLASHETEAERLKRQEREIRNLDHSLQRV